MTLFLELFYCSFYSKKMALGLFKMRFQRGAITVEGLSIMQEKDIKIKR